MHQLLEPRLQNLCLNSQQQQQLASTLIRLLTGTLTWFKNTLCTPCREPAWLNGNKCHVNKTKHSHSCNSQARAQSGSALFCAEALVAVLGFALLAALLLLLLALFFCLGVCS